MLRALAGVPVRVGTENRAKLEAVRQALGAFAARPESIELVPVAVASGVPEQPIGWSQITQGARRRARAALASGDGALGVGIEDGLVRLLDEVDLGLPGPAASAPAAGPEAGSSGLRGVFNVGCAWITDGEREGFGYSSAFAYPPGCLGPAFAQGEPIGDLFDALWRCERAARPGGTAGAGPAGTADAPDPGSGATPGGEPIASGRRGGNIGLLTQGRLDRSAYGAQAIVCALVHFLHTDLYDWGPRTGTL